MQFHLYVCVSLCVWAILCRVDLALWKKIDVPNGSDIYMHVVFNLGFLERKQFVKICVLSDSFIEFLLSVHPAVEVSLLCIL